VEVIAYQAFDSSAQCEIVLLDYARGGLRMLYRFVEFCGDERIADRRAVVEALTRSLKVLTPLPVSGILPETEDVLPEGESEESACILSTAYCGFLQSVLASDDWHPEHQTNVLKTSATLALYLTRYAMATSLEYLAGREVAIERMKEYMDWRIQQLPLDQNPPKNLREMRDRDVPWNRSDQGQDAVTALRSEHELLKKVTACRIHHVLEPYGDPEIMQVIACYPDFANIRRTNPRFALTRTQDLMIGGDYCDTCFHDQRHADESKHPAQEVFDRLTYPRD